MQYQRQLNEPEKNIQQGIPVVFAEPVSYHDRDAEDVEGGGLGPAPIMVNPGAPRANQWRDGLCDCLGQLFPSCCMASFFPCIQLGQIQQKIGERACIQTFLFFTIAYILYGILQDADPNSSAIGLVSGIISFIMFLCVCQTRTAVRRRYDIEGDECGDCCTSWWCPCCTLAQMSRHIYNYQGSCEGCPCNFTGDVVTV